jgi:hypothetical protein
MRNVLLTSVAVLALTGCNAGNASSVCSAPNTMTALEPLLQEQIVDVINLASTDDPYSLDMKDSDIITVDEGSHKTTCKILLRAGNKANPLSSAKESITGKDWINYSVESTDNNDNTYVELHISGDMANDLNNIKVGLQMQAIGKKMQADNARRAAEQKALQEKAAVEQAEANAKKEQAASTIDTNAACDDPKAPLSGDLSNVVTVSAGVCAAYFLDVQQHGNNVNVRRFKERDYKFTMDGVKVIGEQEADQPFPHQVITDGQQRTITMQHTIPASGLDAALDLASHCGPNPSRHCLQRWGYPVDNSPPLGAGVPVQPIPPATPKWRDRARQTDPAGMY